MCNKSNTTWKTWVKISPRRIIPLSYREEGDFVAWSLDIITVLGEELTVEESVECGIVGELSYNRTSRKPALKFYVTEDKLPKNPCTLDEWLKFVHKRLDKKDE